jgi:hypothetical protein
LKIGLHKKQSSHLAVNYMLRSPCALVENLFRTSGFHRDGHHCELLSLQGIRGWPLPLPTKTNL